MTRRVNLTSDSFKPIHSGLYITGRGLPQRMERETRRRERQYDAPAAESSTRKYDVDRYESPMDDPRRGRYESPMDDSRSRRYESPVDDPRRGRYESPVDDPRRGRYESPVEEPRRGRYESPVDDSGARKYEAAAEDPRRRYDSPGTGARREDRTAEFQERLQRFREKADRIMAENMDASKGEAEEPEPQRRVHFANIEPQEEEESFHGLPVARNEVEPVFEEEEEDENKGLDFYQMFEKFKARTEAMLGEGACAKQDTAAKEAPQTPDHEEFEATQEEEEDVEPPQQMKREVKAAPVKRQEDPPKVDRGDDLSNRISDRLEAFKRRAAQAIEVDNVSVEEDLEDGQFSAIEEEEDFGDVEDDQY